MVAEGSRNSDQVSKLKLEECTHPSQPWIDHVSTYSYYEKEPYPVLFTNKDRVVNPIMGMHSERDSSEWLNLCNNPPLANSIVCSKKANGIKERPEILLLAWEYPPHLVGGLAKHVHGLSRGLHRLGYKVIVITANPGHLVDEELMEGIHIYRVKSFHANNHHFLEWVNGLNIAIVQKALELSALYHFAVMHAHDWLVSDSAISLKLYLHIPLISTIHATEHGRNKGIYTELQKYIHEKERQLINKTDHIIVCSDYMNVEVMELFEVNDQKISIIPNGVEENQFPECVGEIGASMPLQVNKRLIFSIGRIVREKGFDTLIEAARLICDRFHDVYFIIAGKGPMLDEYRSRVKQANLENKVFFVGFVTEEIKSALYKACTIAVFPSKYEPFGIVALEAMIAEKPTIVSNTGGLKGIIQHKETGLFMTPGDAASFIDQAAFFLENKAEAQKIAQNGKRMVEKEFGWQKIAIETKKIFDQVMMNQELIDIQS
ncbi:glycosyltransferase family 4 protein [Cytobacillus sp. FJAT-53684]|uniref:Glycosyltransferase family 4 protein n=1 Tax=Cytobacillus mangrovibacter TaxID=3299024 RepID=A0ABW6JU97_9BACI